MSESEVKRYHYKYFEFGDVSVKMKRRKESLDERHEEAIKRYLGKRENACRSIKDLKKELEKDFSEVKNVSEVTVRKK